MRDLEDWKTIKKYIEAEQDQRVGVDRLNSDRLLEAVNLILKLSAENARLRAAIKKVCEREVDGLSQDDWNKIVSVLKVKP